MPPTTEEKPKRLFEAIEFAARAHAGQFRKGTNIPYIVHPLGVAKTLIECGCSEELVVAAILHDTVEDTPTTLEDIRQRFGDRVAWFVDAASEPNKSDSWEDRKHHTIENLETASVDVLLLVLADKLDNIRAIREDYQRLGEAVWSRFKRAKENQRWYYKCLADLFAKRIEDEPGASLSKQFQSEVQKVFSH